MKKHFIVFGTILLLIFPLYLSSATSSEDTILSAKEAIEKEIQLAENYYMLMLDEGIGTRAQKKSETFILKAQDLLKNTSLSKEEKQIYTLQLDTIKKELNDYISVKYHTLEGYFPLLKYTASSFFFSPEESEVHTLMKNPDYIAVKNAAKSLVGSLSAPGEVVFNSIPNNSALEKISFSVFNSESALSSHMDKDVVSILKDLDLIAMFRENNITNEISNKLFEAFSGNPLYVATIEKQLSDKNERFYSFDADYYDKDGYSEEKSVSSSGYAIDERSNWIGIIALHLVFLFLAFGFAFVHEKKVDIKTYSMTLIFFLFGRIFPLIMVPTIMSFKPDGDIHVIYSSWWIIVMGVAILILPVIAIKLFYGKAVDYLPLPKIEGKGELVGFAVASGTLAFLTVPYIFSFGNTLGTVNILAFFTLSLAILFSGYVTGKVLDDNDKMDEKNLVVFVFTAAILMAAFLHGQSIYLILASLITLAAGGIVLYLHNKNIKKAIEANNKLDIDEEAAEGVKCNDLESIDLRDIAQNPPYQKFDYYAKVWEEIQTIFEGKSTYCALKGEGGAGKTATAKVLIDTIGTKLASENQPVIFLSGACERNSGNEVAYGMFYKLLDSTLDMDLFGQREKDEKFDNVVNMASRFLMGPIASFLATGDSGQSSFSKNDIYIFVKQKFSELSDKSTLIVFIDDLQWIDAASKDLLIYLMGEYKQGSEHKILFLFTVRDTEEGNREIDSFGLSDASHSIGFIDRSEQRQLLEKSFCISPKSSRWIVDWSSEQNSERIYPYILVDAVGNLARSDVLEIENDRFTIKEDFDFENPPIPEGPQKEIEKFMADCPEHKEILSFAAMFGKEFNVSCIASGLDLTYLEAIRMLDTISRESGLLFDVLDKDDIYQFRSQIILDAIRANIAYSNEGIKSAHVSQAIRHFHALAASSLVEEQIDNPSSKLTMEIANHYYAAGKLYADKAIECTLAAATACRNLFQYDDALGYLDKADEVLMLINKNRPESDALRLLIECDRSNVYGVDADQAASKALTYIEGHQDCLDELKFVAARACYDAGAQKGSQEWFAKTVEFSEKHLLASTSKLLQAEGHHFIGISLSPRDPELKASRFEHLESAAKLTKETSPMAYAKIVNSLAEALSYGDEESKARAMNLFMESLQIKENAEIKDLPGIARTYGGLGRLAFFASPPKTEEAKEYFQKDLEIAEEISDQRGISQMNSFLGSCSKTEEKYEDAIVFYDKSIQMENNPFDVHASYEGKFFSLSKLNDIEDIVAAAKEYEAILEKIGTPPEFLANGITSVLEKYKDNPICQKVLESLQKNG